MASVQAVYNTLKDVVNKEQRGFVTPAMFNNFAQVAQLNVYNKLFDGMKDAHRKDRAGFNPKSDKSYYKRIEEDLSYFSTSATINKVNGVFDKDPNANLARIISATTFGTIIMGTSTRVPIELCYDESKIDRILISDLSAPSTSHPVALVGEDIEVFPSSIQKIRLRYYKYPQGRTMAGARSPNQPNYAVTAINGNDTFDTVNSIDFELPDHYLSDLVYEVAQLAGLSIRDNNVITLMQQEEAENQRDRTF
jgi:hypothetical protein